MTEQELARGGTSADDHPSRQGGDRHLAGLFVSRDGAPALAPSRATTGELTRPRAMIELVGGA